MLSRSFSLLVTALLASSVFALDSTQQNNADIIAQTALNYGTSAPDQACVTAVATAITESSLYMYANRNVPASLNYPHDKVGSDHDSVGLFQQRVSIYKNIAADMDAAGSTRQFLAEMVRVSGWQTPTRYEGNVPAARNICNSGSGGGSPGQGGGDGSYPYSGSGDGSDPYAYDNSGYSSDYGQGSGYSNSYTGTGSYYDYNNGGGAGSYEPPSYGYGRKARSASIKVAREHI
ncbi:hypothetical protein OC846_001293 [Tilletia horrida]|uniref:Uncharacterized protein n=1 Tax=Tilletia horrida TaxID=155126 RepID=A0AAN6GWJ7_9BASI|nr:hypothetical protein OC846_001293 [Tilletia horrida]